MSGPGGGSGRDRRGAGRAGRAGRDLTGDPRGRSRRGEEEERGAGGVRDLGGALRREAALRGALRPGWGLGGQRRYRARRSLPEGAVPAAACAGPGTSAGCVPGGTRSRAGQRFALLDLLIISGAGAAVWSLR